MRFAPSIVFTMPRRVKNETPQLRAPGQTRISAKHQVTIPIGAFKGAGLSAGDTIEVEALGAGRIVLTRQAHMLDEFSGALTTGGTLRKTTEQLGDEWA